MKILTTSFLTCAVKSCRSSPASFPLHFRDAQLFRSEIEYSPLLLRNLLPRLDLDALDSSARELGLEAMLPPREILERIQEGGPRTSESDDSEKLAEDANMKDEAGMKSEKQAEEEVLKKLHTLLIETSVQEGKLVCGNCGFEYPIKEGVGNFLLPGHLV
jgi:multifunctional methyltransferase subunit TRM112